MKYVHKVLVNPLVKFAQVGMTAVTECGFEILHHSPYSPGMAYSDFYLFPKLKSHLLGTQYGSNVGVIEAMRIGGPGKGVLF